MHILPTRADFLWVAQKGQKAGGPNLLIQGVQRRASKKFDAHDSVVRIGFTASKKVGNAPQRARAKRRMRELAKRHLLPIAIPNHDYVLIAKSSVCTEPFAILEIETHKQLKKLNKRLLEIKNGQKP